MKAYIIRVKDNQKSEYYAQSCLKSCSGKFEAELFEGTTPKTLSFWEKEFDVGEPMENSRAMAHKNDTVNVKRYITKKSCFVNHVRLWNKCIEINQPIVVLEHDSHCIKSWDNIEFDEYLILNIKSAYKQEVFSYPSSMRDNVNNIDYQLGINQYTNMPLVYKHTTHFKGSYIVPGTAAYAITPKGANKLLSHLHLGWEQSDYYINTKSVNIQYITPEYFTFVLPNLKMSHGIGVY